MKIQKKIHFIWYYNETKPIHPRILENCFQITSHNPEFSIHVINKHECDDIVKLCKKEKLFNLYERNIQKCDFLRYALLHKYGGVYLDTDIRMTKYNFNDLFEKYPQYSLFLCVETILSDAQCKQVSIDNPVRKGVHEDNVRVSNYFIASAPKHPFWNFVFRLLKKRASTQIVNNYDIIYSTGPDIISTSYHRYTKKHPNDTSIKLLHLNEVKDYIHHFAYGMWRSTMP